MAKHGKEISDAAVKDMEYAEAACKETLRLNPIVGSLFRKALRDFEVCGYRIRKVRPSTLTAPCAQNVCSLAAHLAVALHTTGWVCQLSCSMGWAPWVGNHHYTCSIHGAIVIAPNATPFPEPHLPLHAAGS